MFARVFHVVFLLGAVVMLSACMGPKQVGNMAEMRVEFDWDGKGCQLSSPNPELRVYNVPAGTAFLKVKMTDFQSRSYPHGGGTIEYTGDGIVPAGALSSYKGPCPPDGKTHKYEFDVQALNDDKTLMLGRGKAAKKFRQ